MELLRGELPKKSELVALDFHKSFDYKLSNTVCLYTDGSKIPGSEFCGFSVITEDTTLRFRTLGFTSIYIVEAMAIMEALLQFIAREFTATNLIKMSFQSSLILRQF